MVKEVLVRECRNDDILAETVYREKNEVLAVRYTKMNDYIRGMFLYYGVSKIKVIRSTETSEWEIYKCFMEAKEHYEDSLHLLKELLPDIVAGKSRAYERLKDMSKASLTYINHFPYILKILNEEKEYDEYTFSHSLNVGLYALLLAHWLKLPQYEVKKVFLSGLLHDIGKIKIPIDVLNKKERLTESEFNLIKQHPQYGFDILKKQVFCSEDIRQAVLCHHEKMDGTGYPMRYKNHEINLYSKILSVADVYDAITTNRIYRKKLTPFQTFEILKTIELKNLDSDLVKLFIDNISVHYVGTEVLLGSGEVGEIAYIPPQCVMNPIVKIKNEYFDSYRNREKNIIQMI